MPGDKSILQFYTSISFLK